MIQSLAPFISTETSNALKLDEIGQVTKDREDDVVKRSNEISYRGTDVIQFGRTDYRNKETPINERNEDWLMKTVLVVIEHLNKFGACVIDDFLGEGKGNDIFEEVLYLRKLDMFQKGQLVSDQGAGKSIRSDKIAWTEGVNPPCPNLQYLMNTLDSIIMSANKTPNNGVLSNYCISSRTKAMVACYPGEGTHYVKHVDNPKKDGRCITAIYYLNRDWKPEIDGGALMIYSACVKGVVAQVDPIFDRMIFFWSDRRNPHEVLPTFRERYAITMWYMDEKEKRDFEEKKNSNAMKDEI